MARSAVPGAGLSLCSGLAGYRATTNCRCAGDPMSLFNASDRISPDCDRQAMAVRLTPLLYAATLFVSALLLFSIQPMFAKMVLPKLGGAPAVWSVAMVFFQTVLLAGYAYAHLLNRVLAAALGGDVPPCAARRDRDDAADRDRAWVGCSAIGWDGALAVRPVRGLDRPAVLHAVGQRAAAAKLVRRQRAQQAGNPYVLYAASNLGSFAALFAYPVVIEPFLTLKTQTAAWSIGFALLAMLLSLVAVLTSRAEPVAATGRGCRRYRRECRRADAVDRARRRAIGARHRGHRLSDDRYRRRTIPVGGAACDLPADFRRRVPRAAMDRARQCGALRSVRGGAARGQPDRRREGVLADDHRAQPRQPSRC